MWMWKWVTCCAKSVGGLLWRPYVSLQTEQWFYEVHFGKDWPHYPKVTAAKAHGLSGLTPAFQHVSHAAYCCFLRAEERMEKREDKWDWMWHGPVATRSPGTAQSGSCHWCNTAHRSVHSTDLALCWFLKNVPIFKRFSASDISKLPLKKSKSPTCLLTLPVTHSLHRSLWGSGTRSLFLIPLHCSFLMKLSYDHSCKTPYGVDDVGMWFP